MSQYWVNPRCLADGDLSAGAPFYGASTTAASEVKSSDPMALCSHV